MDHSTYNTSSGIKLDAQAPDSRLATCASRAVGVEKSEAESTRFWLVAMVKNNTERVVRKHVENLGYECYLPTQKYTSVWKDGRKKVRERILLPGMLMIRLTEAERKTIVTLPWIKYFMMNTATIHHQLAIIPDDQMSRLKFMLGQSDTLITFSSSKLSTGTEVKIIRGSLAGLTGTIVREGDQSCFVVQLDCLGCAMCEISKIDVEPQ